MTDDELKVFWVLWAQEGPAHEHRMRMIALEWLNEYLDSGFNHLSLTNLGLTSLPDELYPDISTLDISNNKLTALPAHLPQSLLTLHTNNNALKTLPDNLPASLRYLDTDYNNMNLLPDPLFQLSDGSSVEVEYHRFSKQNLQTRNYAAGYQGPQIYFSVFEPEGASSATPLHETASADQLNAGSSTAFINSIISN